jgi:beta-lactamase class A
MRYLCSDYLTSQSQQILAGWMIQTKTGLRRLRAGLPGDWRAGDKTGTVVGAGGSDKYNDVAIVWPPGRAPVIVAAYYNSAEVHDQIEERFEAVLGDVGRIVVDVLAS